MKHRNGKAESAPFDRFRALTRKLVAVPKAEADREEAAYQQRKRRKKRRKPA